MTGPEWPRAAYYVPDAWVWHGPPPERFAALDREIERRIILASLADLFGPRDFLYVITDEVSPREPR